MSEWQPIESAPRDGRPVLLHARHHSPVWRMVIACWRAGNYGTQIGWYGAKSNAASDGAYTHWMPLPEPPK